MTVEHNYEITIATLSDWMKSLAPVFQPIHPCHTAAILSLETKRVLFYHAKPCNGNRGDEA